MLEKMSPKIGALKKHVLLIAVLVLAACSNNPTQAPTNYIAVDQTKYATPEAMQTDIAMAKSQCSAPKRSTDYQTGRNAVSAIRAANDEADAATFDACMAQRGFLRQN